jgi:hypothetical protein
VVKQSLRPLSRKFGRGELILARKAGCFVISGLGLSTFLFVLGSKVVAHALSLLFGSMFTFFDNFFQAILYFFMKI